MRFTHIYTRLQSRTHARARTHTHMQARTHARARTHTNTHHIARQTPDRIEGKDDRETRQTENRQRRPREASYIGDRQTDREGERE